MGRVKNSIGNGAAKELIRLTHGHELRRGTAGGNGGTRCMGTKGENWNYNSIINKIYLKNKGKFMIDVVLAGAPPYTPKTL